MQACSQTNMQACSHAHHASMFTDQHASMFTHTACKHVHTQHAIIFTHTHARMHARMHARSTHTHRRTHAHTHARTHTHTHRALCTLTSRSALSFSYLSSWKATPLRVTVRADPLQSTGCVCKCHCSEKTPAFGDLNTNGNLRRSPGRITPGNRSQQHRITPGNTSKHR